MVSRTMKSAKASDSARVVREKKRKRTGLHSDGIDSESGG